jgi:hypothetical protein
MPSTSGQEFRENRWQLDGLGLGTRAMTSSVDIGLPGAARVPIGPGGEFGPAQNLPLTVAFVSMTGFHLNGIEASPDGRTLLVVQFNTGHRHPGPRRLGRPARVIELARSGSLRTSETCRG